MSGERTGVHPGQLAAVEGELGLDAFLRQLAALAFLDVRLDARQLGAIVAGLGELAVEAVAVEPILRQLGAALAVEPVVAGDGVEGELAVEGERAPPARRR